MTFCWDEAKFVLIFVREHLYKHHFVEVCQRCNQIFDKESDLKDHIKAIDGCSSQPERDYAHGFDAKQRVQLRSRSKESVFRGVEDSDMKQILYWKNVYHILFPGVDDSGIPNPGKLDIDANLHMIRTNTSTSRIR
jgi:hypothetical protein